MNEKLLSLKDEIKSRLGETQDLTDLDKIRVSYLGKKGSITALLKGMKDLPNEERKTFGAEVNKLKAQAAQLIEERLAELKEKEIQREIALMPQFDITSPVALARGSYHPITLVQRECEKIFSSMGFNIEDYSEIVTDYECFESNLSIHHLPPESNRKALPAQTFFEKRKFGLAFGPTEWYNKHVPIRRISSAG